MNGMIWPKEMRERLKELYEAREYRSLEDIAKEMGLDFAQVKRAVARYHYYRHPDALSYARSLNGKASAAAKASGKQATKRPKLNPCWPPHKFEDDPREARRPFNPDPKFCGRKIILDMTYGGVPSGWEA
jgi:hypothetical protein